MKRSKGVGNRRTAFGHRLMQLPPVGLPITAYKKAAASYADWQLLLNHGGCLTVCNGELSGTKIMLLWRQMLGFNRPHLLRTRRN